MKRILLVLLLVALACGTAFGGQVPDRDFMPAPWISGDSTDVTALLRSTLADASKLGVIVGLDSGVYLLTDSIVIQDVELKGHNATLLFQLSGSQKAVCLGDNGSISGFTIDVDSVSAITGDGTYGAPICVGQYGTGVGYSNISISDLVLTSERNDGNGIIIVGNSYDIDIDNIQFPNSTKLGRAILAHWGNTAFDTTADTGRTYHPHNINISNISIDTMSLTANAAIFLSAVYNVHIDNVHILKCNQGIKVYAGDVGFRYADPIYVDTALMEGQGIEISNVYARRTTGVGFVTSGLAGTLDAASTVVDSEGVWYFPVHLSNSTFRGPGTATANGAVLAYSRGVVIDNCEFSYYSHGFATGVAVYGAVISNSRFLHNQQHGLYLNSGTDPPQDITIRDCYIADNNIGTGAYESILIGNAIRTIVDGCRLGLTTGEGALHGIHIAGGVSGTRLTNNYVYDVYDSSVSVAYNISDDSSVVLFVGNRAASGVTLRASYLISDTLTISGHLTTTGALNADSVISGGEIITVGTDSTEIHATSIVTDTARVQTVFGANRTTHITGWKADKDPAPIAEMYFDTTVVTAGKTGAWIVTDTAGVPDTLNNLNRFLVASGTSDSIGYDTNGGAIDGYLYPTYLREGANVTFTIAGEDTLTIAASAGSGLDTTEVLQIITDNPISSAQIADSAITNADVSATAGIEGSKLADNSIDEEELSNTLDFTGDVITFDAGEITYGELFFSNNIVAGDIATQAVGALEIENNSIAQGDIATGGVASDEIADGTVDSIDLANVLINADGGTPLTADWAAGDWAITGLENIEADTGAFKSLVLAAAVKRIRYDTTDVPTDGQVLTFRSADTTMDWGAGGAGGGTGDTNSEPMRVVLNDSLVMALYRDSGVFKTPIYMYDMQVADSQLPTKAWVDANDAGAGSGEVNTLADTGTFNGTEGFGLAGGKTGVALKVKGLIEGSNITITADGDSAFSIASTGGGGSDTSVALGDATGSPTDTMQWYGDTLYVNSSNDTTWIRSGDVLVAHIDSMTGVAVTAVTADSAKRVDTSIVTAIARHNNDNDSSNANVRLHIRDTVGVSGMVLLAPLVNNGIDVDTIISLDTLASHVAFTDGTVDSADLAEIYVDVDGGSPLTGNWAAGDFDITGLNKVEADTTEASVLAIIRDLDLYTGGNAGGAYDSTDAPADGDQMTWNTGGTITWELAGGGAGEANTLDDSGTFDGSTGFGFTQTKAGVVLRQRGLIAGSGITLAYDGDTAISVVSAGGGSYTLTYPSYRFNTATTDVDHNSGDIAFNSATPASVTELYIDDATLLGYSSNPEMALLDTGYIIALSAPVAPTTKGSTYRVTGTTDNAGYWTVAVTHISSTTLPAANDTLLMTIIARDVRTGFAVAGDSAEWNRAVDSVDAWGNVSALYLPVAGKAADATGADSASLADSAKTITDGSITGGPAAAGVKMAQETLDSSNYKDGGIIAADIKLATITANRMSANAIGSSHIVDDSVRQQDILKAGTLTGFGDSTGADTTVVATKTYAASVGPGLTTVDLTADVGATILPVANGGTNAANLNAFILAAGTNALSAGWDAGAFDITAQRHIAESLMIGADADTVSMYISTSGAQTGQMVFRDSATGEVTLASLAAGGADGDSMILGASTALTGIVHFVAGTGMTLVQGATSGNDSITFNSTGGSPWDAVETGSDTSLSFITTTQTDTAFRIIKVAAANRTQVTTNGMDLAIEPDGALFLADSTADGEFRVVLNSKEGLMVGDSVATDSAFTAGRISTDSIQLGEGWISQLDGTGLTITSGVLNASAGGSFQGKVAGQVYSDSLAIADSGDITVSYRAGTGKPDTAMILHVEADHDYSGTYLGLTAQASDVDTTGTDIAAFITNQNNDNDTSNANVRLHIRDTIGVSGMVLLAPVVNNGMNVDTITSLDTLASHVAFTDGTVDGADIGNDQITGTQIIDDLATGIDTITVTNLVEADTIYAEHIVANTNASIAGYSTTSAIGTLDDAVRDAIRDTVGVAGMALTTPAIAGATLTGALDAGAATTFEIPNSNDPSAAAVGEIEDDANNDGLEVWLPDANGTAQAGLLMATQTKTATIILPDSVQATQDAIPLMHVNPHAYPFGITLISASLTLVASGSYDCNLEEWSGPGTPAVQNTTHLLTLSAGTYFEVEDATFTDAVLDADDYLMMDLEAASGETMITVNIVYFVNDGN